MSLFLCNVITVICLIIYVGFAIGVILKIFISERSEAITYLRNFKKGSFAVTYLTTLPLYIIAYMFGGFKFRMAFFNSLAKMVHLIVLKYDYKDMDLLMSQSPLFDFTLHFGFALVACTALLLTLSLVHQQLTNSIHLSILKITRKPRLYIFGEKKENVDIYNSEKSRYKMIIGDLDEKEKEDLYLQKVFYHRESANEKFVEKLVKSVSHGEVTVVINEVSDELNLKLCARFNKEIEKFNGNVELMKRLKIYVFGNSSCEEIYLDEVKHSKGCLRYLDPYHQVAIDLINKYPISSFLTEKHVDYQTALINKETDLNVFLIGFGRINKEIFLTSVANNQFLSKDDNGVCLKPVNYYIFDKGGCFDKNVNHYYYRYKNIVEELNQSDYLPLPQLPSNDIYFQTDINSPDFYKQIKEALTKNKNAVNTVVIALGEDLENVDIAKKLCSKRDEWGVENCTIFVKNKSEKFGSQVVEREKCFYFGNESQVYDMENIVAHGMMKMALLRNEAYDLEYKIKHRTNSTVTQEDLLETKKKVEDDWYLKKSQAERDSSIYCCLSLRSKLHLLGLDYCEQNDERQAISEEEYLKIYAKEDALEYFDGAVNGKKVVKYKPEYSNSTRTNLAILEHYRWNAFMIIQGFIPATKEQILNEKREVNGKVFFTNGKNYQMRHHGNLTTFNGLKEFSEMIAERDNLTKEQADVISYDYQIMDDAYWLLTKANLKIVKR